MSPRCLIGELLRLSLVLAGGMWEDSNESSYSSRALVALVCHSKPLADQMIRQRVLPPRIEPRVANIGMGLLYVPGHNSLY
jgi:hypothetical protein